MIVSPLEEPILMRPFRDGADELKVLSGYCGAGLAARHLAKADEVAHGALKVELVYGMAPTDGVPIRQHEQFRNLVATEYPDRFRCNYVVSDPAVHSKIYVWLRDGNPKLAYAGSANYSLSAFGANRIEVMTPCDPVMAYDEFSLHKTRSIECEGVDVGSSVLFVEDQEAEYSGLPSVRLPFIDDRTGETPMKSGINWGQRLTRDKNQAYLRVLSNYVPTGFFPPRRVRFTVLMDDGFEFEAAIAQDSGKALHSTESNAILGKYFRKRLALADGEFVARHHFEQYGRDDVTVYKIDDETFFMDFAV